MNQIDLRNQTAVVTGGAQGIGRACVERFAASGAARIAIWDFDSARAQQMVSELTSKTEISVVDVDISSWDAVQTAAEKTTSLLGNVDILVNNAGISGPNASVSDYPIDEWNKILQLNLNGVFYCCKAIVPMMATTGYGRIVNVASVAGKEGNPNAGAYSASKAAVIALTKSLGKELADKNIAVNCVTPSAAKTAIFDQMTNAHIDYMLSKIPRGRFVEVDEIAAMIAWLASEDNSFTTGAVFDISGGRASY